jgi:hypothetical protein
MQMRAPGASSVSRCALCNFVHDNAPEQDFFRKKGVTEIKSPKLLDLTAADFFPSPELKMMKKEKISYHPNIQIM